MQSATFLYTRDQGWSVSEFPALDAESTLVFLFGGSAYIDDPSAIDSLTRAYPKSTIIGCSSAGEIHGTHIVDDALSVAVVRFDRTRIRRVSEVVTPGEPSVDAGAKLGAALAGPDLRAVFVLSDGIAVNGSELLSGIHRHVDSSVVVTGGLAGDGTRFKRTWVMSDNKPSPGVVVAVGLYGDSVRVSHGSRGGWDPFGPERVVTRSSGNVLFELDGEPALSLYKTYLGERAAGLPATALLFPLALRARSSDSSGSPPDKTLVRTILAVDEEKQSMTFAGDVPEESVVQLMRANFDRLIEGASEASRIAEAPADQDSLLIAISCVGRRIVLGERTEEEVEAAAEVSPAGQPLVGFYSYGEISPFAPGQCGSLHNQTMTLTRIWEA